MQPYLVTSAGFHPAHLPHGILHLELDGAGGLHLHHLRDCHSVRKLTVRAVAGFTGAFLPPRVESLWVYDCPDFDVRHVHAGVKMLVVDSIVLRGAKHAA